MTNARTCAIHKRLAINIEIARTPRLDISRFIGPRKIKVAACDIQEQWGMFNIVDQLNMRRCCFGPR